MGLCRFDPCVFSLAVAVPATRNRFVRFAIFSFSLGLPSATKSILAVPTSDAIFLRFRWGSVVLGVLEGASSNGFLFSFKDSKGNVRHFFGVVFAWHGLESCCCSAVLEEASSNGFVSSLMDSKGQVTLGTFSACFLRGVGSNFAAVRVFRRRSARGCFVLL